MTYTSAPGLDALARQLAAAVAECWERGWQPAELVHVMGRCGPDHRRVAGAAVALEGSGDRAGADPDWAAQARAVSPRGFEISGATAAVANEVLRLLRLLPSLPALCPPPSSWANGVSPAHGRASACPPKMASRIRHLLAKAESTSFPDEAEAL